MVKTQDIALFRSIISADAIDKVALKNLFDLYGIKMEKTKNRCYSYRNLKHELKSVHLEVEAQKAAELLAEQELAKINKETAKSTTKQLGLKQEVQKLAKKIIELNSSIIDLLQAS